jgi:PTS system N-acetylglucosamine-specific IIC component
MALMDLLGVKLGFGFSAGAFDYVLNYKLATKPWMLGPVGLAYFALYYGLFRFFILRFDLKTPGREVEEAPALSATATTGGRGEAFITALGGGSNLVSIDACTTRLRLVVADQAAVSEPALKALGARGFIRPSPRDLQVVLGPIADDVAREMRDSHHAAPRSATPADPPTIARAPAIVEPRDSRALLAALGGAGNLAAVAACSSRLRLELADLAAIDEPELRRLGARGLVRCAPDRLHVILGPAAEAFAADLKDRLSR